MKLEQTSITGWKFAPQPDITTYELAMCITHVFPDSGETSAEKFGKAKKAGVERHFAWKTEEMTEKDNSNKPLIWRVMKGLLHSDNM